MPWKIGEKAWFLAFFSCSKTQIEPRNSPPCWKIQICFGSVCWLLLLWGRNSSNSVSVSFPLYYRRLLSQTAARFCLLNYGSRSFCQLALRSSFWFYVSEVSKFMVMPV
ncbi:hypothetical protein SLEP1_g22732 [Rubroshorea leprosula]|uniref:Secreted protein n=1 Tax=Rubroshorea leprosula TaxID=152421 RepID=A0AAV5JL08_9ROSI|nr:hypothetical protein SLEP1_g22732 [Rubroshorea leprosula]